MPQKPVVAIVGGSGTGKILSLESIGDLLGDLGIHVEYVDHFEEQPQFTPFFVKPEGKIVRAVCREGTVLVMNRHGDHHQRPPSGLNFHGNIWALKAAGVTHYWATTTCGSLTTDFPPSAIVLSDDYLDAHGVGISWFSKGPAVHLAMARPTCAVQDLFLEEVSEGKIPSRRVGHACIKGPRFSTRFESVYWRSIGADVVGMTMAREAELVRGAQMHGSWLCLVTDWDAWHTGEEVSVEVVLESLRQMAGQAERIFLKGIQRLFLSDPVEWECGCRTALQPAIQTPPEGIKPDIQRLLDFLST